MTAMRADRSRRVSGGWLVLLFAAAMSGQPVVAATVEELSKRCRSGDAKACGELIKIAKTARETDVWLAALRAVADPQAKADVAASRLASVQTREGVKQGVLLGRLALCSPSKPPEGTRTRHLRGCILVDGDRIQDVAAAGIRIAPRSEQTVIVILEGKPGEFGLDTLLAALAPTQELRMPSWSVGGTSVEFKTVTVRDAATVPMRVLGEWDAKLQRLTPVVRLATIDGTESVAVDQIAP